MRVFDRDISLGIDRFAADIRLVGRNFYYNGITGLLSGLAFLGLGVGNLDAVLLIGNVTNLLLAVWLSIFESLPGEKVYPHETKIFLKIF